MKILEAILLLNIIFFITCSSRNLKEVKINELDLYVTGFYDDDELVGKKGTIVLRTDYPPFSEDIIDTTKTTCFESTITNLKGESLEINCGLWRKKEEYLLIFCNVDENIPEGEWFLNFNEKSFNYSDYLINLNSTSIFNFTKTNIDKIDIYSDKQTLNLDDGNNSYDLKFRIVSYNQEKLILNWKRILDSCNIKNDELICTLTRSEIEMILDPRESLFLSISYLDNNYKTQSFPLVAEIDIIYNTIVKKDINVLITKLIEGVNEHDSLIAYETNVKDIDKIYMELESFDLPFVSEEEELDFECTFRKYEESPLLLVCFCDGEGEFWLNITKEIKLDDINIKYNFIINPVIINDKLNIDRKSPGSFILWVYPEILDFTKKDSYTIDYNGEDVRAIKGITFNEKEKDLDCTVLGKELKRCVVPKSHFNGKKNGYYFTKHQNHLNTKSFSYEAPPIKIILSESKGSIISFSLFFSLILFIAML